MKDYQTFNQTPRKSEIRFEIDELLRELDQNQQPTSFVDTIILLLNGFIMAIQFIIWKWNEKSTEPTYGFKVSNMFYTCTFLLCIVFYVQARLEGGVQYLSTKNLISLGTARACVSFANILQMIGLLYITVETAVALWFSKIFMVALAQFVLKGDRPARLISSILVSGFMLIGLYVMYINASGPQIFGVIMTIFSMFFYGFTVVLRGMLFDGYSVDKSSTTSGASKGFWLCFIQLPLFAVYITLDGLFLTKPLKITDFIPGYQYDFKACVLLIYLFGVFFIGKHVLQHIGSHQYVITSYTGNFLTVFMICILYGSVEFSFARFLIIALLYVNSMTCELTKVQEETIQKKDRLVTRFKNVTHQSQLFAKNDIPSGARKSKDMTEILKDALDQLQRVQEVGED